MSPARIVINTAGLAALTLGCGGTGGTGDTWSTTSPIVYGSDDRKEYFDTPDADLRRLAAEVTVALMERTAVQLGSDGLARIVAPSWREKDALCEGEPFAEQPAAASCTGTLVGDELVLTAGHCLDAVPCADLVVVFGFHNVAAGELRQIANTDVVDCAAVIAKHVDLPSSATQVDYAWIQLASPRPGRPQISIEERSIAVTDTASVQVIGFGGGVPAKIQSGARVTDPRAQTLDYFVTNLDAFHGASGAAVYDSAFRLLGILGRGGTDLVYTDDRCYRTFVEVDSVEAAREQATYAFRALDGLPEQEPPFGAGCSVSGAAADPRPSTGLWLLLLATRRGLRRIVHKRKREVRGRSFAVAGLAIAGAFASAI